MLGALLFFSCTIAPDRHVFRAAGEINPFETREPFIITDFNNYASGGFIPEWVSRYLSGGLLEVEAMDYYRGYHVFISHNEGINFTALTHWSNGFDTELDFPRLAAARIEKRYSSNISNPDNEYGSLYEALIRAASDAYWYGAQREEDFWIRKMYITDEDADLEENELPESSDETWEFLILVTIEKHLFASQLENVFRNVKASPNPTKDQVAAANRVRDRFFEGF